MLCLVVLSISDVQLRSSKSIIFRRVFFFCLSLIYFYFIFHYYGFFDYSINNNLLIALKYFSNLLKKIEWVFRKKAYIRNFV